jgi:hypothetical protein
MIWNNSSLKWHLEMSVVTTIFCKIEKYLSTALQNHSIFSVPNINIISDAKCAYSFSLARQAHEIILGATSRSIENAPNSAKTTDQ